MLSESRAIDNLDEKVKVIINALEPLRNTLAEIEVSLYGYREKKMIRDLELSKLVLKRIRSLAEGLIMYDDLTISEVQKLGANILKMASDTLSAIEGSGVK